MKPIDVPVSPGELLDKITILEIKARRLRNEIQRLHGSDGAARCESSTEAASRWMELVESRPVRRLGALGGMCSEALHRRDDRAHDGDASDGHAVDGRLRKGR